ncbi:hypothetical protein SEA_ROBYN_77 [Mycobacterium phage Robyn]|uniref:Uncharacterized protein n=1 Tax=Mycobacterium phage Robyn TaxID=2530145 RepID=A0A481W0R2_9CAUD|nr:hypothetical protein SEA_ROBYN_77 [Mycobacterium phage Robyn]
MPGLVNAARSRCRRVPAASDSSRNGVAAGAGATGVSRARNSGRWAHATKQPWARKKAHETKGGKVVRYRRLPESKHSGHKGRRGPSRKG